MCVCLSVALKYYLVSYLRALGFRNPELIKSYIRRGLAMGYGTYNFVKYFKVSGVPCARILNEKIRKREDNIVLVNSKKREGRKK